MRGQNPSRAAAGRGPGRTPLQSPRAARPAGAALGSALPLRLRASESRAGRHRPPGRCRRELGGRKGLEVDRGTERLRGTWGEGPAGGYPAPHPVLPAQVPRGSRSPWPGPPQGPHRPAGGRGAPGVHQRRPSAPSSPEGSHLDLPKLNAVSGAAELMGNLEMKSIWSLSIPGRPCALGRGTGDGGTGDGGTGDKRTGAGGLRTRPRLTGDGLQSLPWLLALDTSVRGPPTPPSLLHRGPSHGFLAGVISPLPGVHSPRGQSPGSRVPTPRVSQPSQDGRL